MRSYDYFDIFYLLFIYIFLTFGHGFPCFAWIHKLCIFLYNLSGLVQFARFYTFSHNLVNFGETKLFWHVFIIISCIVVSNGKFRHILQIFACFSAFPSVLYIWRSLVLLGASETFHAFYYVYGLSIYLDLF